MAVVVAAGIAVEVEVVTVVEVVAEVEAVVEVVVEVESCKIMTIQFIPFTMIYTSPHSH